MSRTCGLLFDRTFLAVVVKLFPGTIGYFFATLSKQTCVPVSDPTMITSQSKDCPPGEAPFAKPLFLCLFIFLASLMSLLVFVPSKYRAELKKPEYNKRTVLAIWLPSFLDYVSFILGTVGMLWIPGSLQMLLKGSRIIFSALLTMFFLKRRLFAFHWVGVLISMAGIAFSSIAAFLDDHNENKSHVILGIGLSLVGELMRAMRSVVEEKMMGAKGGNIHPAFIRGMEGVYLVTMIIPTILIAWAIPSSFNFGSVENLQDTLYRFSHSPKIVGMYMVVFVNMAIGGLGSLYVTFLLSSVHNAIISESRALVMWLLEVLFYYGFDFGGKPINQFWYCEFVGFALVLLSVFVYNGNVRVPGLRYPSSHELEAAGHHHAPSKDSSQATSEEKIERQDMKKTRTVSAAEEAAGEGDGSSEGTRSLRDRPGTALV